MKDIYLYASPCKCSGETTQEQPAKLWGPCPCSSGEGYPKCFLEPGKPGSLPLYTCDHINDLASPKLCNPILTVLLR